MNSRFITFIRYEVIKITTAISNCRKMEGKDAAPHSPS